MSNEWDERARQGVVGLAVAADEAIYDGLSHAVAALQAGINRTAERIFGPNYTSPPSADSTVGYLHILEAVVAAYEAKVKWPVPATELLPPHQYHALVVAMCDTLIELGADPARIHALLTTGMYLCEKTGHLFSQASREAWERSVQEYRTAHPAPAQEAPQGAWVAPECRREPT